MTTNGPLRSRIEHALCLETLEHEKGTHVYVNVNPPWNPSWGRGLYGGAIIAQSLGASQATLDSTFDAHSFHGTFLLPARVGSNLTYYVECARDGKSFATRIVRAKQNDKYIFTATIGFSRPSQSVTQIRHGPEMPWAAQPPPEILNDTELLSASTEVGEGRSCDFIRIGSVQNGPPHQRKLQHWMRARGPITSTPIHNDIGSLSSNVAPLSRNYQTHTAALAYMTDNYFIGTAVRTHNARRFTDNWTVQRAMDQFEGSEEEKRMKLKCFEALQREEDDENKDALPQGLHVDMMVSLDHTIYFHNPRQFCADDWMLVEMESPWADHERGLVTQRIWTKDGILVATCIQEGVIRLKQTVGPSHL
ncbi:acyl-CoA thioesterase [Rhinocladiella similis]